MIIEAILELIVGAFTGLLSLMVTWLPAPPTWWVQVALATNTVLGTVGAPIRHFLPLGPLAVAGATLIAMSLGLSVLKLARRALSLFTGGGGSIE